MDRDKPRENRHRGRINQKRIWITELLNSNWLKLGAGVSLSVATCGLTAQVATAQDASSAKPQRQVAAHSVVRTNSFVTPTRESKGLFSTPISEEKVVQTSDMQTSQVRLKSIGTAVGLVPIGNPRSVAPGVEVSYPSPTKIRVNPLASGSADRLEQPVTDVTADTESTATTASSLSHRHDPKVLSIKRCDRVNVCAESDVSEPAGQYNEATNQATTKESIGFSFSFSDAAAEAPAEVISEDSQSGGDFFIPPPPAEDSTDLADASSETRAEPGSRPETASQDAVEELPLLPTPVRQWVQAAPPPTVKKKYPRRHRPHVDVASPPMISVARDERRATIASAPIVQAKLAGFVTEPVVETPDGPLEVLAREIRDSFPTARVSLSEVKKRMIVRGECSSDEQATEIIRMIRSRHLVPVDDHLVIR